MIDFSDWGLERTEIDKIPESSFSIVAQTDGIVVGLTRQIVDRMRKANLANNVYGWGKSTLCIIIIRIVLERFLLLIEAYLFGIRIGLNIRPKLRLLSNVNS